MLYCGKICNSIRINLLGDSCRSTLVSLTGRTHNCFQTSKRNLKTFPSRLHRFTLVGKPFERHCTLPSGQAQSAKQSETAFQCVARVLEGIEGTDRGADASEEVQSEIEGLLEKLESIGQAQVPRPLENTLIFGNYDVAYVSTRQAPKQDGQPAGGRFRSGLGRTFFRTRKVCQSVIQPDVVTNKVEFSLFGFLPGHVGLRGKLEDIDGAQDTVKVFFEKPELCVAGLSLRIGPESSVVLKTTYLDETVRLGTGSRGSKFVFVRGGDAEAAGMDQVGRTYTKWWGMSWVLGVIMGLFWTATALLKVHCGLLKLLRPTAGLLIALAFVGAWREKLMATAH